jgi:endonuclease III
MAANPFQRFARGAAAAAPTAVASTIRPVDTDTRSSEKAAAVARKRKRAVKDEPDQELPSGQSEAATELPGGTSSSIRGDRRVWLLQQLVEARCDGPDAAIDRYGTQACVFRPSTTSLPTQRFHILVAALLSSQTQDPITYAAMQRLHTQLDRSAPLENEAESQGLTIAKVRTASVARLEELLVPVGFYRRKAQQLHQISETLARHYKHDIPRTLEGLLALPGVGPKIARVILLLAWDDVDAGLIVDTHILRLSQRLGWVPEQAANSAEQTRAALEDWVPRSYWRDFSRLVVGFGQTVCVAVHPNCIECPLAPQCPSAFKSHEKKKKTKKSTTKTVALALAYEQASDDAFES